jgi:uncharacterized membrane protein YdjX (TVP38/TMEM64 family)
VRIALIGALIAALVLAGRAAGSWLPAFAVWIEGLGLWGPVVFILGYALATVAFAPGSILTLAAGAIFGLWRGALLVFAAALLGSSAAFLIARHLARPLVARRLAGNDRFAAIDRAIGERGGFIVLLLRLSPVFPFNLLNYALGLTGVRFVHYLLASIGMLPGTFLYVYYGRVAGDLAAIAGGAAAPRGAAHWLVLGIGLAATVVATAWIARTARRALQAATRE